VHALAVRRARELKGVPASGRFAGMSEHVYKSVEITGSSPEGVTPAIDRAIAKASETLRHLDWFELTSVRGQIVDGRVGHYQATLKIGFRLED
jgi:flavin-binding protein dodecin